MYNLILHNDTKPEVVEKSIAKFKLTKPNSYPYGIQEYEKLGISNEDFIKLYSFSRPREKSISKNDYHAKLVLIYYDAGEEDLAEELADWNTELVLRDHSEKLELNNLLKTTTNHPSSEMSHFQGFAFGEDGR